MKTRITTALVAAASLSLAACGGSTTNENVTVSNEAVLDDGGSENLTAVDDLNSTGASLDNAAIVTDNTLDAPADAGNAVNAN